MNIFPRVENEVEIIPIIPLYLSSQIGRSLTHIHQSPHIFYLLYIFQLECLNLKNIFFNPRTGPLRLHDRGGLLLCTKIYLIFWKVHKLLYFLRNFHPRSANCCTLLNLLEITRVQGLISVLVFRNKPQKIEHQLNLLLCRKSAIFLKVIPCFNF